MKSYTIVIRKRIDERRVGVSTLSAIAKSAADALLGVMDKLPQGALVTVRPA